MKNQSFLDVATFIVKLRPGGFIFILMLIEFTWIAVSIFSKSDPVTVSKTTPPL